MACCFGIEYDYRRQLQRQFQRIISGEIKKFPKDTFEGTAGRRKAAYLFAEFVSNNIAVGSIEELYERCADTAYMNKMLEKLQIYHVCYRLYSSPLEYCHYSLAEDERDGFMFTFLQFMNVYKETALLI